MSFASRNATTAFCKSKQVRRILVRSAKKGSRTRRLSTLSINADENNGVTHAASPVQITITRSTAMSSQRNVLSLLSEETQLVDSLLQYTDSLVDENASNIIAFSGGVDSSLAAALVHRSFHSSSAAETKNGNVKAVLGVSASLPERQLRLARDVASTIGIDLVETSTNEGADATYIENNGQACFVCKNHLYSALTAVSEQARAIGYGHQLNVIMYNGTNADDTTDPTRLGLVAAKNFSVRSPLIHITKDEVRRAARHLNLPNWNFAASPCLRSRLALGVEATEKHLNAVNMAEERVRTILGLDETMNLRVRMLAGQKAMVEMDHEYFGSEERNGENRDIFILQAEDQLRKHGFDQYCKDLGFVGGIGVRPFKSGAVSR